jgi:hypothetical protein
VPSSRREVEAATSESLFREVNEHLRAGAGADPGELGAFVCECADVSCAAVLTIPLADYERVRQHGARFVVAADDSHVDTTLERVVERHPDYWVVEKLGPAGNLAKTLDE